MKHAIAIVGLLLLAGASMAQVEEAWVRRYNGPGNAEDAAVACAVDGAGNVYVTGYSESTGTGLDYATVKYAPDGSRLWVRRYNGPGNGDDYPYDIAVDAAGNAYVTGFSVGTGSAADYTTVKYAPDGTERWVARYDGPGGSSDVAYALALDGDGNAFVTGVSPAVGGSRDYATVKYDSGGTEIWTRRYDGPGSGGDYAYAIAVDEDGSAYVTGYSSGDGTGRDYLTIKYGPGGTEVWVRRYSGPNGDDEAHAIAVDGAGNTFVTGRSYGTGNVNYDYATVKYAPNGTELWVRRYNGPGNSVDWANAIALDDASNVCVTGKSYGDNQYDYATIRYDSIGTELWIRRYSYDAPWATDDKANAIAVDRAGNAYVAGGSIGDNSYDYATVKYGPDGTQLWVARYNDPTDDGDDASDIALDTIGNVYVAGTSMGDGTDYDYATIKYRQLAPAVTLTTPNGGESWAAGTQHNITWNSSNSVKDSVSYSTDNGATWTFVAKQSPPTGTHAWTIPNTPSTQCLVMVSAIGNSMAQDESDGTFTITGTGLEEGAATNAQPYVELEPNPVAGRIATLVYRLPAAGPVHVRISDITGRTVLNLRLAATAEQEQSRTGAISLDLRDHASGVYSVRLDAGDFSATRRLLVQR